MMVLYDNGGLVAPRRLLTGCVFSYKCCSAVSAMTFSIR